MLVRPIRQQQTQSPVVKIVDGPVLSRVQSGSHGDQQANHLNGAKTQKPTNTKEAHTMYFANQVKDVGTNISVKMGATYNMVSEYTLISKFEEAWNKLNELAAQWQQAKQPPVTKKPTVTKAPERPSASSGRDKVVMVAQQQPQQQQILQQISQQQRQQQTIQLPQQQQQTIQQLPQQQQRTIQQLAQQQQQTIQRQTLTTPVQLVPISAPHHVTTPVVHGDVVSVLPSPAHVISTPPHVISTPGHVISTPVVIPAVARSGSDVTYYSIPSKPNPTTGAMHPQKNRDEVYMVQVVKPVAPVMPVTPVMSIRSSSGEKRTAQQCDVCSKKASFLCSGCQSAWYCGRTCQVSNIANDMLTVVESHA